MNFNFTWPSDGLEWDRPLTPEARVDDLEELGLPHEVALHALVDGPVEARPVLRRHPDDERAWNSENVIGINLELGSLIHLSGLAPWTPHTIQQAMFGILTTGFD